MATDKYNAVWVSHTSISDFLRCPRAYFLKNIYRDRKTGHKVKLISPSLTLGQTVHEVLEDLSELPREKRLSESLVTKFNNAWSKVSGKRGGFLSGEIEYRYKQRGEDMMRRVMNYPGPIAELSVKINMELPYFWLSEEDGMILCGKIDWLEYLPASDSVHIIDFKTGKAEENSDSLQLPIYHLLVNRCQKHPVTKVSYWYLDLSDELVERPLPDLRESAEKVYNIASEIKLARQISRFRCPAGETGCVACRPYERILSGEAELVGQDDFGADAYILPDTSGDEDRDGTIL